MPRFRRLLRWGLLALAGVCVLGLLALGKLYFLISSKLPDVQSLRHVELQEPMYVYAKDGRLMALFGETRRYPVDIEQVPERDMARRMASPTASTSTMFFSTTALGGSGSTA